jgi:hypothetical protein
LDLRKDFDADEKKEEDIEDDANSQDLFYTMAIKFHGTCLLVS